MSVSVTLKQSATQHIQVNITRKLEVKSAKNTSCGGTSNDTVLRSTFVYVSIHGSTKKIPAAINNSQHYYTLVLLLGGMKWLK